MLCTVAPFLLILINRTVGTYLGFHIPLVAAYAAMSTGYAFGEGLGRLACISFGCCYGKPVPSGNSLLARLFNGRGFVFLGKTKKAVYAGGLESVELIPVQALTAVVCTVSAFAAIALFLRSHYSHQSYLTFEALAKRLSSPNASIRDSVFSVS